MTKKKDPADLLPRGPKKGSGAGLTERAVTSLTPAMSKRLDKIAKKAKVDRSEAIRLCILYVFNEHMTEAERLTLEALIDASETWMARTKRKAKPKE